MSEVLEVPEEICRFLLLHPTLQYVEGNKVRCKLTGHELPCRLSELQVYTSGKEYKRLLKSVNVFDYSEFEPHVVPSTKNPHQLFCKLTLRHINKVPEHVLRHVQGRRYLRALQRYQECQKNGTEYIPACLRQKKVARWGKKADGNREHSKKGAFWKPASSEEEEEESDDSLSDLYPPQLFRKKSTEDGKQNDGLTDSDEEEVVSKETEKSDGSCQENGQMDIDGQTSRKRQQKQMGSLKKKFKSHHCRPKRFQRTAKVK
ncbi:surfeit locus protein 2 [Microcaecilia unicolor]|uniref:Surfeit locus protein 2 n=1 Tax=Microcaecilia unicolor TaxID=1415580 RepID=A0A6P7YKQ9_9AMPH|nr:surfeit locus protein 2 [Microcaecilia unicolor]XP_030063584.1 surfeit locus protein 2 [Microcaecilia unicolor]